MILKPLLFLTTCLVAGLTVSGQTSVRNDGRDADRAAIRAHIDKIFKAYIDGDCQTIRATHAEEWIGFTGQSRTILHGIDAYMGGSAPFCSDTDSRPANGPGVRRQSGLVDYKITEMDYVFYGDVALVPYVAETWYGSARYPGKLRSLDVYAKVNREWTQVGSNIYSHPDAVRAQMEQQAQQLRQLSPEERQTLLMAREAVWRAFFSNDQAQLEKLIPAEALVIDGSSQGPIGKRADIIEAARNAPKWAGRLMRLEFPVTETQVYGQTAILYTTYLYELEDAQGKRTTQKGRATEMFVRQGGNWVNTGWHLQPDK